MCRAARGCSSACATGASRGMRRRIAPSLDVLLLLVARAHSRCTPSVRSLSSHSTLVLHRMALLSIAQLAVRSAPLTLLDRHQSTSTSDVHYWQTDHLLHPCSRLPIARLTFVRMPPVLSAMLTVTAGMQRGMHRLVREPWYRDRCSLSYAAARLHLSRQAWVMLHCITHTGIRSTRITSAVCVSITLRQARCAMGHGSAYVASLTVASTMLTLRRVRRAGSRRTGGWRAGFRGHGWITMVSYTTRYMPTIDWHS